MKTKKSILNFITEVIPLILVSLIGLYKSKVLINELATDYVGLYQLFSQVLGYVTIFEFGMTSALLYRLFEPVAKKNQEKINILFYTGKKIFSIIAVIMFVCGIIISFFIPILIKDNPFSMGYISITFLMYITINIIYYLIISYKLLLDVEQKKHITNIIFGFTNIIKSILEILAIVLFKDLFALLAVGIITNSISALVVILTCKKYNPDLQKTTKKDYTMLGDIKNLFVHKIAYLVNNNIDLIIVTKFLGLASVVIYSTYNFIANFLKKLTSRIYVSIVPSLGNLLVEDKDKARNVFYEMNELMNFLAMLISLSLFMVINPFIDIWYAGKVYTSILYALGFSMILFITIEVQTFSAFIDAGGCFKETKKSAIMEAAINLILSLILHKYFGIFGILIATFISYFIADNIFKSKIICEKFLKESPRKFYKDLILYYLIIIALFVGEYFLIDCITYSSIFTWLFLSILIFVINFVVLLGIFKIFNKLHFLNRVKSLLMKRRKKEYSE